jgi:cell division protein FtsB
VSTRVPLKEFVLSLLAERDKALLIQVTELERRLTDLNHAHQNAAMERHTYLTTEVYDARHRELEQQIAGLREQLVASRSRSEGVSGVGRVVVASATVLGVILTIVVLFANHSI